MDDKLTKLNDKLEKLNRKRDKIREIFENTIENGNLYEGSLKSINYYSLSCKAFACEQQHRILKSDLCMFNCSYDDEDAILMLFSVPINTENSRSKDIAERIMDIVYYLEVCFSDIDFLRSEEEEKFVYVTAIKKIGER